MTDKKEKATKEKATKTKKQSTAFERKWPTGNKATAPQIKAFIKLFPHSKDDKLPTRMEVIRAAIKEENNFDADSIVIVMETIFGNSDWGKVEADSARRREFRNIANPKDKKPRGRPAKDKAKDKAEDKAEGKSEGKSEGKAEGKSEKPAKDKSEKKAKSKK